MAKRLELIVFGLLIALTLGGGALRFINLDGKEFWHDECFTALVLSGHTSSEMKELIGHKIVRFSELEKFRSVGDATTVPNIFKVIGQDEPGHAPIFYFIAAPFCQILGSTPFAMRLAAALISMLTLPIVFWLGYETYRSRMLAALTMTTAALSPFLIFYAQEARDYSLGILWMFLSSSLLLYALRTDRSIAWKGYTISIVLACYSWLFTAVVIGGHVLYMCISQGRKGKSWRPFLLSIGVCGLLFLPWLLVLYSSMDNFKKAYDWMQPDVPLLALINAWLTIPYKALALFGFKTIKVESLLLILTIMEFCAAGLAATYFRSPRYLQLCIIVVWFLIFGGQDLLFGGARSAPFRYQTTVIGSIIILLPTLIEWLWARKLLLVRAVSALIVLFMFGIEFLSDGYYLQAKIWPDKAIKMRFTYPIAVRINQEKEPIIVCEERKINLTEILDLSCVVKPDCQLLFLTADGAQPIPKASGHLYLWNPSEELEKQLVVEGCVIKDSVDGLPYLKEASLGGNE